MRTTKRFYHFRCLLLILIGGCAPSYIPNTVNSPLFTNKKEFQAAIHQGISGFDPQFAYAVTDKLGVMLNSSFANRSKDSLGNFHKHAFVEGGAGYYRRFADVGRFEVYSGLGLGRVRGDYSNSLWASRTNVSNFRFFIQPAVGRQTKFTDLSLATRFAVVDLYQGENKSVGVFIEPVVTARFGYRNLKAVVQAGFSLPANSNKVMFAYMPFMFSLGLQMNLKRIYLE